LVELAFSLLGDCFNGKGAIGGELA
jgi:hypothetical protein